MFTSTGLSNWLGVASSADGKQLVAIAPNLPIYRSVDFGASWQPTEAAATNWQSVASSADGSRLVATVSGGGIYTWQTTPVPALSITPLGPEFLLSWLVPSSNFVLQQNSEFAAPSWITVPMTPVLNYTNLHYEVTVPRTAVSMFYRLAFTPAPP